jgi:formylglycine-generating enzyme required for sulfatase activity
MEKTVLSANTILQGRYRIIQLLGHGGMGAVYEAMDENLRCRVTIKETFATDAEKEVRKAFEREACLLANIRHPAVPKVSDYFEEGDGLFFVMEFIPGVDLAQALKLRGRPFQLRDVLGWADALLAALSELHSFDPPIVHKDIKPSNLKRSPKGEIFLLDFGLAKGALGQMSTVRGPNYSNLQGHTPHFAPPEQIARTGTSLRSDLYSLAATLWCMLTNTLPPDAMMRSDHITNGQPDPLRLAHELNPEVPHAVSAVLNQAMSLSKTKRPADAAEMREALREAVEAPLREQAERARREEEEKVRREAEAAGRRAADEEFARRLKEERAAHATSVQQLKEEHESALSSVADEVARARAEAEVMRGRALTLDGQLTSERKLRAEIESALANEKKSRGRRESEAQNLGDLLKKSEAALERARRGADRELADERERLKQAESARDQMAASVKEKEAALAKAEYKTRVLESQVKQLVSEAGRLEPLLQEKLLALRAVEQERDEALRQAEQERDDKRQLAEGLYVQLTRAEKERDKAQKIAKTTNAQLVRVEKELYDSRHSVFYTLKQWYEETDFLKWLSGAAALAALFAGLSAVFLVGVGIYGSLKPHVASSSVAISSDKSKVSIGDVDIETVKIPGGSFMMGSPDSDATRNAQEKPQHAVTVQGFQIGKYEVTQAQWRAVAKLPKVEIDLNEAPATFKGDDLPVANVSWGEAIEFCARLSKATGLKYRLPTEAEWEYAARGVATTDPAADPDVVAWDAHNSGNQTLDPVQLWKSTYPDSNIYRAKLIENGCGPHPVGQKAANGFGLYDMLGNVWEWCSDDWHADYNGAPGNGTEWAAGGDPTLHIGRGGSWFNSSSGSHPATRTADKSDSHLDTTGFRVVVTP